MGGFVTASGTLGSADQTGALGSDVAFYDPSAPSAIPDTSSVLPLATGSPDLIDIPTTGSSTAFIADPSGSTAVSPVGLPDGGSNPNNDGGFMQGLSTVLTAAQKSFSTYVSGSPAVATPPAVRPGTVRSSSLSSNLGLPSGVNWTGVAIAVGAGVVALVALGYLA